jgi:hypothetical protein
MRAVPAAPTPRRTTTADARRSTMSRKHNRPTPRRQEPPRRSRIRLTPSKIFIAIIVLMIAVAVVSSLLTAGDDPECPPGQVWSDAHNHCH